MRYTHAITALICAAALSAGCSDSHEEPPADVADGTDSAELGPDADPDANPDSEDDANPNNLEEPPIGELEDVRGVPVFALTPMDEEREATSWPCRGDATSDYVLPVCVEYHDDIAGTDGQFVALCAGGEWTFRDVDETCRSEWSSELTLEEEVDDGLFTQAWAATGYGFSAWSVEHIDGLPQHCLGVPAYPSISCVHLMNGNSEHQYAVACEKDNSLPADYYQCPSSCDATPLLDGDEPAVYVSEFESGTIRTISYVPFVACD